MVTVSQFDALDTNDSRVPLLPVSMNLPLKMRPPLHHSRVCRPSVLSAPTRLAQEIEPETEEEKIAAFRCEWRGCNSLLFSCSILRKHVRICHCKQSGKEVSTSSTRKRKSYSCQYGSCRNQGYLTEDELLTHIVSQHFRDIKIPDVKDASGLFGAYNHPSKRVRLATPASSKRFTPENASKVPFLPDYVPSWKLTIPIIRPSRSKELTTEHMISRIAPISAVPVTWMSWTDTPDKEETTLIFRDMPTSFHPDQSFSLSPASYAYISSSRRIDSTSASLHTSRAKCETHSTEYQFGFRKPLLKERMTLLAGDRAQGFRSKLVDPDARLPVTIGFEHSLTLKEHLKRAALENAAKRVQEARLRAKKKRKF